MILFIGNALRTASASALNQVPLDLQAPVTSLAKDQRAAAGVARQPGVAYAAAAATAPFSSAERSAGASRPRPRAEPSSRCPAAIRTHAHLPHAPGRLRAGGVVLDQQMAATLQAQVGDTIRLRPRPNARRRAYTVSGVALITAPDQLFQPLNPLLGPAPAQPPQNAAIMPPHLRPDPRAATADDRHRRLGRERPARRADRHPVAGARAARPRPARRRQPLDAPYKRSTQTVNRVQSALPGQVQFVDNLSDSLNSAAGDSLYAETLFLLLAVPGALIALGVAYLAALGTRESDRRDLALLRARGARPRDLLGLAAVESVVIGVVAGMVGSALGWAAVQLLVSGGAHLTFWRGAATLLAGDRPGDRRLGGRPAGEHAASVSRRRSAREASDASCAQGRRPGAATTSTSPRSRSAG